MFMTAAGTTRPALVLVIGAGVAGLQAIGTARRLGAIVTGYDVRDAARSDVLSTGASFLDLGIEVSAVGDGGYARELTAQERSAQQDALNAAMSKFDIVITTAQVPGRRPPLLVSSTALAGMRAGSVVVDLGSSPLGGNVEGSKPGGERRHRQRSDRGRRHQPAVCGAEGFVDRLLAQHLCTAGALDPGCGAHAGLG